MPGLPDNSIDLILTDPPYKDYQSNRPRVNPRQKKIEENDFDLPFFFFFCYRLLKSGRHLYCFCYHITFPGIRQALEKAGLEYKNCLVWVKDNHGSGDLKGNWAPQHEFIIYCSKGKRRELFTTRPSNVLNFHKVPNEKYNHGTAKPERLLEKIIEVSTQLGEVVLDPYAGVMSTAAACINTGRKYIMIEKDPEFFSRGEMRIGEM